MTGRKYRSKSEHASSASNVRDQFLVGRSIYLRAPNIDQDVFMGEWYTWFNDERNTKFLTHGVFPVTVEQQAETVKEALADPRTLMLCIMDVKTDQHVGVVSLKNIDYINRTAEIGIVTAPSSKISSTGAFEAMSLVTRHAFYRLNMDLLYAGQHEMLWKWVNSLSMLAYRINGFRTHGGVRDRKPYAIFLTSVSAKDFIALEKARGGDILNPSPLQLLKQRPRTNPANMFLEALDNLNSQWESKKAPDGEK